MRGAVVTLEADLLRYVDGVPWEGDDAFGPLALRTFRFQCEVIPAYGAFARHLGRGPDRVRDWREIPAVPVSAFRSHDLGAAAPGPEDVTFETSGTTISRPGRVRLRDTALYEASLRRDFQRHLLPDGARLRAVVFGPPKAEAPNSSLWFMADHVARRLSAGGVWIVEKEEARWERADEEFHRAASAREPLLLLGTTILFHAYFERCRREGVRFGLPPGSRAMDTGGAKRTGAEISREEIADSFASVLGIPGTHVVNEYGMTEMGSQFYEDSLLAHHEKRPPRPGFTVPPWVRTRVFDPETMEEVVGGHGFLVHHDLANLEVPAAIQTEDVGALARDRLTLTGRLPEAERRGCSLPFERFVEGRA